MTNEADKPSVEGLLELVYEYGREADAPTMARASSFADIGEYAERLASAAAPAEPPATTLREVLSDERLTQLARDCGLTWRLEGGPTRGICLGPGTAIEAFARALLAASSDEAMKPTLLWCAMCGEGTVPGLCRAKEGKCAIAALRSRLDGEKT